MFKKIAHTLILTLLFNVSYPIINLNNSFAVTYSESSLVEAVINNDIGMARYLLRIGVDVNAATADGVTPLMIAIENKNMEMISLLLRNGADVNVADDSGDSVYCYGEASDKKRIKKILERNGAKKQTNCGVKNTEGIKTKSKDFSISTAALLAGLAAIAAGGGGGGGGGSDPITPEQQESEYLQARLNLINAQAIYDAGYTGLYASDDAASNVTAGDKVKIAIIDDGVDIDHETLVDNISDELTGTNISVGGDDPSPTDPNLNKHGTHVAGIMVGKKDGLNMHGVAYNAELTPYNVTDPVNTTIESIDQELVSQALQDIITVKNPLFDSQSESRIIAINNSYGTPTTFDPTGTLTIDASDIDSSADIDSLINDLSLLSANFVQSVKDTLEAGVIMVWAAGNEGNAHPSIQAGLTRGFDGVGEEDYDELVLVVVASNEDGTQIADYSNRCGVAKNFCVMAPGTDINSTFPNDTYGSLNGTSMAAPMVTGAAAVIKGAAPNLTNEEIVDIILGTATDMGAVGVDDVYGHGMLNLQAALAPIGTLVVTPIPNDSDLATPFSTTSISTLGIIGEPFRIFNQQIMLLDSFERSYYKNVSDAVKVDDSKNLTNYLSSFMLDNDKEITKNVDLNKNTSLSFSRNNLTSSENFSKNYSAYSLLIKHNFKNLKDKSISLQYAQNNDVSSFSGFDKGQFTLDNLQNPYMTFITNLDGFMESNNDNNLENIGVGFNLSKHFNISLNRSNITKEINSEDTQTFTNNNVVVNLRHKVKGVEFKFSSGITKESDTFLGSYFGGAFDNLKNSVTNFYGLNINYKATENISFFGNYITGFTKANLSNSASLLNDISDVRSNSFTFGLVYNDIENERCFGLQISQPLRISDGSLLLSLPQDRDYEKDEILFNTHNLNLKPSGREIDIETYYKTKLSKTVEGKAGLLYIVDKNHNSEVKPEIITLMNLKKSF